MNNSFPGFPPFGAAPPSPRTISPIVTDPSAGSDPIVAQNPNLRGGGHILTANSQILLAAYNVATGLTLRVSGMVQTRLGEYVPFARDFAIAATGAEVLNAFSVGPGNLTSVYVSVVAGTPGYNDVYAEVGILEGTVVTRLNQVAVLLAGNVSGTRTLGQSVPSGVNTQLGTPSQFNQNGFAGTYTLTVPTGKQLIIRQFKWNYLTDATAGNRLMTINVTSVGQAGGIYTAPIYQAASLNYTYTWGPGLATSAAVVLSPTIATIGWLTIGIPQLHLTAGDTIAFTPLNMLGNDTMTVVALYDLFSL